VEHGREYDRGAMATRSPARYLAPIALIVTIAGMYLIVHHATVSRGSSTNASHANAGGHAVGVRTRQSPLFYSVRQGDNLSAIAARTHVSLTTLEALNPSLDPNSLQTGQRIRLRR
jgi:LysM repeat protein